MEGILQKFQDLKIQLEEITSATNNFDAQNHIGVGGYGRVYKGEVSHFKGRSLVAIKRLDRRHGQGEAEFLKEIDTLSRFRHENIIQLVGFCYEKDEAILVYELASHGSLDRHLNSLHLTWSKRIKICLDAARGLGYLHDPRGTHQRLIHCDLKGGNILLDDQWNAKIADFGFSIMGPANELQSTVITKAAGTPGYIEPLYRMTNTLTKESDVYSFGVVLLEVLCGRLCCTYSNGQVQQILVPTWIESYKQNKLNDIIFRSPTIQPLHQSALEIFSDIAYQCLKGFREDRPKMADVVTQLETALQIQELSEGKVPRFVYDETPPQDFSSKAKLWELLCEGVFLNNGKTWFSLNKKGEHYEMISIAECLDLDVKCYEFSSRYNSRFGVGAYNYYPCDGILKAHVRTQFLSSGITYMVNLVFKFDKEKVKRCNYIGLKYKLQGETENLISHLAYEREDGWWMCELYHFTCDHRIVHLQILFDGFLSSTYMIKVEGIEFQPLEKVEHADEKQVIDLDSDLDANWEEKMPTDYITIMKRSKYSGQWKIKEEEYSIIRKGFLISDDEMNKCTLNPSLFYLIFNKRPEFLPMEHEDANMQEKSLTEGIMQWLTPAHPKAQFFNNIMKWGFALAEWNWNWKKEVRKKDSKRDIWFSLDKNGKKCHMISSTKAEIRSSHKEIMSLPESRFGEVVQLDFDYMFIETEVESQLVSSNTTYACFLVYKLPEYQSRFDAPIEVKDRQCNSWYIYLASPQTPVIRPKDGQNTHNPLNMTNIKGLPQKRNDGWIEVQIWELRAATTINMELTLRVVDMKKISGLIIEGIEFRPI